MSKLTIKQLSDCLAILQTTIWASNTTAPKVYQVLKDARRNDIQVSVQDHMPDDILLIQEPGWDAWEMPRTTIIKLVDELEGTDRDWDVPKAAEPDKATT